MARSKEFDREIVLDEATDLFWEKGYESTSMEDLVERMGIGRASLYDTFGSKHELFALAMERYAERLEDKFLGALRAPGSPRRIVSEFLLALVDRNSEDTQRGCLMVKSALTTARDDPETAERIREYTARIEEAFYELFLRARAERELAPGQSPRALARYFTSVLQGLSITATINENRKAVRDVVRTALSVLG